MDILTLLRAAKSAGASDVHLVASSPPMLRINGYLQVSPDMPPLAPDDTEQALSQLTTRREQEEFRNSLELDFGYSIERVGRFRCNVAMQQGTVSMVIRLIPLRVPLLDELRLPEICKELITRPRGLVVVSGPTGSGKSTTLAAMIEHLNMTESRRIVTVEDPIEYTYVSRKCIISQRETGSDTHSFADALRHALRQDPDVILVGEMRDLETAAAVLTIAETGHLVLTTGHAPSAPQAVERIVDLFPPHERSLAQSRIASLIVGILCQALVPTADEKGRIAAIEIMLGNPAVKNLIREGKLHQLPNAISTHGRAGMKLLDMSLAELYCKGFISYDNASAFCQSQGELTKLIQSMSQKSDEAKPLGSSKNGEGTAHPNNENNGSSPLTLSSDSISQRSN
ncbi:MAG: type IV pilus twitching motility protein PilT [Chloroflexi bacterium]|nr:type IV pilus twitching motility protein PilT [Chloroflexota bacterium]